MGSKNTSIREIDSRMILVRGMMDLILQQIENALHTAATELSNAEYSHQAGQGWKAVAEKFEDEIRTARREVERQAQEIKRQDARITDLLAQIDDHEDLTS